MSEILFSESTVQQLRGKVVVLTGGAQGIGAATVELAYRAGAYVFFGDWEQEKGHQVEERLRKGGGSSASIHFLRVDVRDYKSQLALFEAAFKEHGRVDVAISCAAVGEPRGWFETEVLDLDSVRKEPLPIRNHIEINLTSVIFFCRIALAFMKASSAASQPLTRSIHGVIGLMRALRPWAPAKLGIRANAICPWATDTQMLAGVRDMWVREKMPMNAPEDVGRVILQCAADPQLNGRAVFVAGGRGFDTEEGIERTQPQWMGEELSAAFNRGQQLLGIGDGWKKLDPYDPRDIRESKANFQVARSVSKL